MIIKIINDNSRKIELAIIDWNVKFESRKDTLNSKNENNSDFFVSLRNALYQKLFLFIIKFNVIIVFPLKIYGSLWIFEKEKFKFL